MKVSIVYGRELYDLVIENRDNEDWVRWDSIFFRAQDTVPVLLPGAAHAVSIGTEGVAITAFTDNIFNVA